MYLFASILSFRAPAGNYRGEGGTGSEIPLQRISIGSESYAVVSSDAIRCSVREQWERDGLPCNRSRLHDAEMISVKYVKYPNADRFIDDFVMGFFVAGSKENKKAAPKGSPSKRDSILLVNQAVAVDPYMADTTFHTSPAIVDSPFKNSAKTVLSRREVSYTAFQWCFGMNLDDFEGKEEWLAATLRGLFQVGQVAGGHARNLFDLSPESIVLRLTKRPSAGFGQYDWNPDGSWNSMRRLDGYDLPLGEFWVGGKIADDVPEEFPEERVFPNPDNLLEELLERLGC